MPDKPDTIYHYCGVSGFHGILTSKTLWLSDAYFMNDYMEHRWILYRVMDRLRRLGEHCETRFFCEHLLALMNAMPPLHPHICCFSSEPDLLSQWRAYSDDGAGFVVGFSTAAIEGHCAEHQKNELGVTVQPVEYEESGQDMRIANSIANFLPHFANRTGRLDGLSQDDIAVLIRAFGQLWTIAALCKNPAFREESEWRLALLPKFRDGTTLDKGIPDIGTSQMCFRVSADRWRHSKAPGSILDIKSYELDASLVPRK